MDNIICFRRYEWAVSKTTTEHQNIRREILYVKCEFQEHLMRLAFSLNRITTENNDMSHSN